MQSCADTGSYCVNCGSAWCPDIGCATYNPTELRHAPHYPTTAELAAFRRRIDPDKCDHSMTPVWRLPNGGWSDGAWSWERERGIGHRGYDDPAWWWDGSSAMSIARREAGAMRTRAFRALADQARGDAGLTDDLIAAMDVFEPSDPAYV